MILGHALGVCWADLHMVSNLTPIQLPTIVPEPEPSKRIHRMVELSRQAGMAEAEITKVRCFSAINS